MRPLRRSNPGGRKEERRWSFGIVKGKTSVQETARAHGPTGAAGEDWKERYAAQPILTREWARIRTYPA